MNKAPRERVSSAIGWRQISVVLIVLTIVGVLPSMAAQDKTLIPLIKVGDKFPDIELTTPKERVYRDYLGLPDKPVFRLNEVQADVLIVEFLNRYCYHCQLQAYLMNRLYKSIQKDPELKNRVKMLGIGVGNNQAQLAHFRQEKRIPFPLIPDQDFIAFEAVGYPGGTPFTLVVKKEDGVFVVKDAHLGVIEKREAYLEKIRQILSGDSGTVVQRAYKSAYETLNPGVSEKEIKSMITGRLKAQEITPDEITRLDLNGLPPVYMITLKKEGKLDVWFAVLASEGKVCDVCNDIHFIYIFDRMGIVRDFIPIHVTKLGNRPFEEADVAKIRKALVGRDLTKPLQYHPETDAVSSASMTSALIFKSVKRGSQVLEALKKEGYTQ